MMKKMEDRKQECEVKVLMVIINIIREIWIIIISRLNRKEEEERGRWWPYLTGKPEAVKVPASSNSFPLDPIACYL